MKWIIFLVVVLMVLLLIALYYQNAKNDVTEYLINFGCNKSEVNKYLKYHKFEPVSFFNNKYYFLYIQFELDKRIFAKDQNSAKYISWSITGKHVFIDLGWILDNSNSERNDKKLKLIWENE